MPRSTWFAAGLLLTLTQCHGRQPEPARSLEVPAEAQPSAPAQPGQFATPPPADPAKPAPSPEPAPAGQAAPSSLDRGGELESAQEEAKPKKGEDALQTLAQAEAELERARQELELALAQPARARASKPAARAPSAAADSEGRASSGAGIGGESRCGNACRAFASLERAASAVCRLAGSSSERCTKAQQLVSGTRERVSSCGCSGSQR